MLIGLTGYKGVGKDTVANYLIQHHDFTKLAFADKLKEAVAALFGMSVEEVDDFKDNRGGTLDYVEVHIEIGRETHEFPAEYVMGWREFLQRFGTEMGRRVFGEDFWVELWAIEYGQKYYLRKNVVATDVRFANEAHRIRLDGGTIIHISRPGHEPDGHESEAGIPDNMIHYIIENDGTIEELHEKVEGVLRKL